MLDKNPKGCVSFLKQMLEFANYINDKEDTIMDYLDKENYLSFLMDKISQVMIKLLEIENSININ